MNRFDDAMSRLAAEHARLAAEHTEMEAPPQVEAAVLAEFDRVKQRRRARSLMAAAGVIAASILAVVALLHRQPAPAATLVPQAEQPFMPIPYVLPPSPYERLEVVRMEVPVAALIAAGLPMQTSDPGAHAEADVLIGQDGRPRAVRLVSMSSF